MVEKPELINTSVVHLVDCLADGIQLQFAFRDSIKAVAFKLTKTHSPSDIANAFRHAADVIESLNDESKWDAPAPKKRRKEVKK